MRKYEITIVKIIHILNYVLKNEEIILMWMHEWKYIEKKVIVE